MKKLFGTYALMLSVVMFIGGIGLASQDSGSTFVAGALWFVCTMVWLIVLGIELLGDK